MYELTKADKEATPTTGACGYTSDHGPVPNAGADADYVAPDGPQLPHYAAMAAYASENGTTADYAAPDGLQLPHYAAMAAYASESGTAASGIYSAADDTEA